MSTKNDIDNIYRQIKFYMILSEYEKYGLKYYRFRSMLGACDECAKRSEVIFFASEALDNRHHFDSHPNCKCVVELINASGEVLLTLDADGNVKKSVLDSISELLTYASLVPGIDTFADIAAIPVDLLRGDFVSSGLDLLGAVPIVGEVADTAKLAKTVDKAVDAGKMVNKVSKISSVTDNTKNVAKKYNLNSNGFFGVKGKHSRIFKTDNPIETSADFYKRISKGGVEETLPNGKGVQTIFDDGSRVVYRVKTSTPNSPAIDISINDYSGIRKQKIHFIK